MVPELDLTSEQMKDDETVSISSNNSLFGYYCDSDDGLDCTGTSRWEELYQDNDGYVLIEQISNTATNSPLECTW
jgi:hypothetical protein